MRTELLLEHFELLRAPQDVAYLEAAILDLAVRGKLVPQDPDDEPASVLLGRVKAKEVQLIREKKIRKPKKLPSIGSDEVPNNLPKSWEWCRLGELLPELQNGTSRRRSFEEGREIIVLRLADIVAGEISTSNPRKIKLTEEETVKYELKASDILITRVNGSIDLIGSFTPVRISEGLVYCDHFIRMRIDPSVVYMPYLVYIGRSKLLRSQIQECFITTAGQKTVNQRHISTLKLPLPPLPEQRRIVVKVDELLTQTRALAVQLQAADDALLPTAQAAFQALVESPPRPPRRPGEQLSPWETGESAPRRAWERVASAFDTLTADPRTLDALKQTVLQLAVQGKLASQDSDDWQTKPIKDICQVRGGIQKSKTRIPDKNPRRYLTVAHVQRNWIDTSDPRYFEVSDEELEKWRLLPGDVLAVEGNGSVTQIGRTALFKGEIEDCVHQNHLIRVRPQQDLIMPEYLNMYFNSPPGRAQMLERSRTTSGLYNLSVGRIKSIEVALPPLPEQRRIVATVEALLGLCDALAAQVVAAEEVRAQLLQAILNGGETTT